MNTYFSRITADHWQAKNKLEEAGKDLAREMDRRLITETELEAFKKEFQQKIDELNQKFSRCKPLSFTMQDAKRYNEGEDIWIYCDGVFNMSLFLVKKRPLLFINQSIPANAVLGSVNPDNSFIAYSAEPVEAPYIAPDNRRFVFNPNADGSYTAIIPSGSIIMGSACSLMGSSKCGNCSIPRNAKF